MERHLSRRITSEFKLNLLNLLDNNQIEEALKSVMNMRDSLLSDYESMDDITQINNWADSVIIDINRFAAI